MGTPIRVIHQNDPAKEIWDDVGWIIEGVKPMGAEVLLVTYERIGQGEKKTQGGIIVPHIAGGAASDDEHQGKVCLVVAMGPLAFKDDDTHSWGSDIPKVGDWVVIDIRTAFGFDVPVYRKSSDRIGSADGKRKMRMTQDVHVRAVLSPKVFDAIW
jgi:co-chaperonin GroES (HSP10)